MTDDPQTQQDATTDEEAQAGAIADMEASATIMTAAAESDGEPPQEDPTQTSESSSDDTEPEDSNPGNETSSNEQADSKSSGSPGAETDTSSASGTGSGESLLQKIEEKVEEAVCGFEGCIRAPHPHTPNAHVFPSGSNQLGLMS